MPAEPTRLAMIGCGLIARAHGLAAARSERDVIFSACSSKSIESAHAFAAEFDCGQSYENYQAMLANEPVDGVVIAAPPEAHADIINECLRAGASFILCEKPLTMNAKEARAVRSAAQKANATVVEGFMYRYHPQIAVLRQLLDDGEIGSIDQIYSSVNMLDQSELDGERLPKNWRRESAAGGGVLHDFLCYPIDIANLMMGQDPVRAYARTFASPIYETVYRIFGMIEYADGAMANVSASRLTDFSQPLFIGCSGGTIRVNTAFNPVGNTEVLVQHSEGIIGQRRQALPVEVPEPVSERLIDLNVFMQQLEHFLDLIGGDAEPAVTLDHSVRNACVRDALIESSQSNQWCDIRATT